MLVKRMEVTVESFLWSQKAEASAGSIRAAVAAQQRHLTQAPARYEVDVAYSSVVCRIAGCTVDSHARVVAPCSLVHSR
jgi:hypothetical protein